MEDIKLFGGKTSDILQCYSVAIRLARRRGKKTGDRIDKEFWEVAEKKEKKHKFRELKTIQDINQYKKEG